MDIRTRLLIWLWGEFVGEDEFGNRYYQTKKVSYTGRKRRWVAYNGAPEASKIPADWHAWIHYTVLESPVSHKKYYWEKSHLRNFTGTSNAYFPKSWKSSPAHNNEQEDEKQFYEPWNPSRTA